MISKNTLEEIAKKINGKLTKKNNAYTIVSVIAERKAFLSTKKLEYIVTFKMDDEKNIFNFSEMLKESGSGLSMGGGFGDDMSPGFGFKSGSYKTGMGPREESIEEQSKLFGKDYQYKFDFKEMRQKFESLAKENNYEFKYQILPVK